MRVIIGSRQSPLAKIQAYEVAEAIREISPSLQIEHHFRSSLGDQNIDQPLWQSPEKGVFTKDFQESLVSGELDMVVHSWKDLPIEENQQTAVVATRPRADARDMFFMTERGYEAVMQTKQLTVLSSSPRRVYNLSDYFQHFLPLPVERVQFKDVRGNIATRINKLLSGDGDILIVAKAAIDRLRSNKYFSEEAELIEKVFDQCRWQVLPMQINPCAAAQGALAIEIKKSRRELVEVLDRINCPSTFRQVSAERNLLKFYGGGCHQKIGCHIFEHHAKEMVSLRGVTEKGKVLSKWQWTNKSDWAAVNIDRDQIWPAEDITLFDRKPLRVDLSSLQDEKHIFVSRISAWPEGFRPSRNSCIWAAGLKTQEKLAEKGIWCHGSSEGMGLESSFTPKGQFVNLTHNLIGHRGEHRSVPTYELSPRPIPDSVNSYDYFLWTSGSRFLSVFKQYPEIKSATHFCMAGATFDLIRKHVDPNRIRLVFSKEHLMSKINGADKK